MKLIIAGSRTFTDYQLLCQTLAPERHRITQVLTAAPGARISSAFAGRSSTISARAASPQTGSALGRPQACAAITRWRRQATCSSRSGIDNPQAPRT